MKIKTPWESAEVRERASKSVAVNDERAAKIREVIRRASNELDEVSYGQGESDSSWFAYS